MLQGVKIRLQSLEDLAFGEGWAFFVPYLPLYLAAWALDFPCEKLKWIFVAMHFANAALFLDFARRRVERSLCRMRRSGARSSRSLSCPAPISSFLRMGGSIFRRIFTWRAYETIRANDIHAKFAYFWGWTTMFWSKVAQRPGLLGFYGAFWVTLVLLQVDAFSQALGMDRRWAKLSTVAFLFLFGNNVFGIRYYALSSTPLAYVAYLRLMILLIRGLSGQRMRWISAGMLVLLLAFNHTQELAFAVFAGTLICAVTLYGRLESRHRKLVRRLLIAAFPACLLYGLAWRSLSPATFGHFGVGEFHVLRHSKPWGRHGPYLDTLGIPGVLALALALHYLRKERLICVLGLAPMAAFVIPPAVQVLLLGSTQTTDTYRLLYSMPYSIVLVACLRLALRKLGNERSQLAAATAIVILLSIPWQFPWRGRFFMTLYRPDPLRSLQFLEPPTALWFVDHRAYPNDARSQRQPHDVRSGGPCRTARDLCTRATRALAPPLESRVPRAKSTEPPGRRAPSSTQRVVGFLIAHTDRHRRRRGSRLAEASGHWPPELGDPSWQTSTEFERTGTVLSEIGWKSTEVPPFYRLYEPPDVRTGK